MESKENLPHIPSPILVLAAIVKLHDLRKGYSQRGVLATRGHIQQVLEKIYHRKLGLKWIDDILGDLQKQGLIFKKRGLLSKKHVMLFGINPNRIFQESFTVIKLDSDRAYVVNRYEGIVYDLESLEFMEKEKT